MVKLARSLILSVALSAAISLVLAHVQPSPASAQTQTLDECDGPCPTRPPARLPPPPPPPPVTDSGTSGTSVNGLADQRFNQMITNRVLGTVLLGVNEQINSSDCIS